jgi:hypothetical protein
MNPEIDNEFEELKDLLRTGNMEVREFSNVSYRIQNHMDTLQDLDYYIDLKRSISNVLYLMNSRFNRILQLSIEEGWSARIKIKILLFFYKLRIKPLIWLHERNS